MKKILLSFFVCISILTNAQTYFSDSFDNGLVNFTIYDVDGLKPAAGVSNVFGTAAPYKAWAINGNKVISTSWYEPAGRSNDWLVTTAPINIQSASTYLTWKAAAYDGTYRDGYQVYISTTGNKISDFTTPVLTIAKENSSWTTRAIDLASYVGQSIYIAFVNNSTDQYILGLDDIFVGGTNFSVVDQTEQYIYTSSTKVKGNIVNNGIPITSFTAKYTAHSQTYTKIYTGLNIAAGATYSFEIPDLITVNGAGETTPYVLEITVGDAKKTSSGSVSMASFKPDKKVIAEEATGTWCGWCPRGAVFLKTVSEKYPTSFIGIAVHNGDPMTNAIYDAGIRSKISGYPSALIDRKQVIDPSQFENYYLNALADFCPASLALTGAFTDATRKNVQLTVKTKFNINYNANANYRIAIVVTENNVKGTIQGYNQSNYYSGGGKGVMGGFEVLPNPVPAALMTYQDVAREISDTFNGIEGSVPATIVNGEIMEYNRTFAIPASVMNLSEVSFIAMLIDANTGQIKNADRIIVSDFGTTFVESHEYDNLSLKIIKSNSEIIVNFVSELQNLLSVSLYGIDGKLIYKSKTNYDYNSTYRIPDAGLKGIYIIKAETSSGIFSKKIVL